MTNDIAAIYKANLQAMMATTHALMTGCQAVNAASLAFLQTRLKQDLGMGQQLVECTTLEDALAIQMEHLKSTLQAYVDQSQKVAELTSGLISAQAGPTKEAPAAAAMTPAAPPAQIAAAA